MLEATVCIAWRPSPSRLKPYAKVRAYWQEFFPAWPVVTADSDTEIFSLSQARNNAVRQAATGVVVLCDADTVAPPDNVRVAVADPVGICWPHDRWTLIPVEYAEKPFEEFPAAPVLLDVPGGLGGVIVCTAEEYWRIGGMPEIFVGWGHEDHTFRTIVDTLSTFRQIGGTSFSIERDLKQADNPGWNRDRRVNQPKAWAYQQARGCPERMRALIESGGGKPPSAPVPWRIRWGATG